MFCYFMSLIILAYRFVMHFNAIFIKSHPLSISNVYMTITPNGYNAQGEWNKPTTIILENKKKHIHLTQRISHCPENDICDVHYVQLEILLFICCCPFHFNIYNQCTKHLNVKNYCKCDKLLIVWIFISL